MLFSNSTVSSSMPLLFPLFYLFWLDTARSGALRSVTGKCVLLGTFTEYILPTASSMYSPLVVVCVCV
ncbi:hypothetical protein, unlikely [Trypanosoma brucei brucei TREU927]|uniref:Secreted protein n=1 Tax=Trypanosoma brucei brucei (strain 927/4 GUTat10.1) TaxID=185431 RepID=Q38F28_TRYB2|nr:hypothetical protein, unlikely [Trypanosoma brucei brucei TREU927]EAN76592.1 hypothetical protein, unlikely [Trypanosoma brucei brucei TREU927]